MTFDSLIAVAGLAAAIWALLPRHRQLDIGLRLTRLDRLVILLALAIVHYLQFYPTFLRLGWTLSMPIAQLGFTPENSSYLVVLAASVFVGWRSWSYKLSEGHLPRLQALSEELLWQRKYAELIELAKRYLADLSTRLREHESAQEMTRVLLTHGDFVREIARNDPYFALKVLDQELSEKHEFLETYLGELVATPSSVLFFEVRNNQNLARGCRYHLPTSNRLLHYLLSNAARAERLSVYRPIGEAVIRHLRDLPFQSSGDPYLLPVRSFTEDDHSDNQWRSPVFIGLRFFDIMIMEALHQGIAWHMWLYYLPTITSCILDNYSEDGPGVDPADEWPTRYSYFLYEIVTMQKNWIRSVSDLPESNHHKTLSDTDATHDNGHIPKSAILSLTDCLRRIAESEKVGDKFKVYLLETVITLFFKLHEDNQPRFAECLLRAIEQPGGWNRPSVEYASAMCSAYDSCDKIPFMQWREENAKLKQVIDSFKCL